MDRWCHFAAAVVVVVVAWSLSDYNELNTLQRYKSEGKKREKKEKRRILFHINVYVVIMAKKTPHKNILKTRKTMVSFVLL